MMELRDAAKAVIECASLANLAQLERAIDNIDKKTTAQILHELEKAINEGYLKSYLNTPVLEEKTCAIMKAIRAWFKQNE